MKNIHIIPTDKPSRLYKSKITQDVFISDNMSQHGDATYNVNIYITSDEEIKEEDWYYNYKTNTIQRRTEGTNNESYIGFKKIILTTDQDLIADGVQVIDDEFLEWFVKNPSCERVEVEKARGKENSWGYIPIINKIIIPKKEPKQETVGKEFYESADKVITVSKQETLEEALITDDSEITTDYFQPKSNLESIFEILDKKQETLEESAENYSKITLNKQGLMSDNQVNGFMAGAKWQQERMYSEEEVLKLLIYCKDKFGGSGLEDYVYDSEVKDWFEQLKKK